MQLAIAGRQNRFKSELALAKVPLGARGTYGAISSFCLEKTREVMQANGTFTEHKAFVLGQPLVDGDNHKVVLVMSTLSLLQNAIRYVLHRVLQDCLSLLCL